jgi:chorismate--pyruvate lyase
MPVKWQNPDQVAGLSPTLSDWLLNTGSLTERLQALTHSFTLCLLGQQVLDMDKSEGRLLLRENKSEHESWQIREVLLQGKPLNVDAKKANNTPLQDWVSNH